MAWYVYNRKASWGLLGWACLPYLFSNDKLTNPHAQKGKPDVEMPPEVVEKTKARYTEVYERLTGSTLEEGLKQLAA